LILFDLIYRITDIQRGKIMIGLITGAGRGLGYELAKKGLELGCEIIGTCRKMNGSLQELKAEFGDKLQLLFMDVTQEEQVKKAAEELSAAKGQIDFLIHCAGVLFESKYDTGDPVSEMDISLFRKTLDVNVTGEAVVLKYFIPFLYASQTPCIISITSEAGNLNGGGYHYLAYSVSKYAQNMLTQKVKNYLEEIRPENHFRIYMIHPGRMDTLMGAENAQITAAESAEGIYRILREGTEPMAVPFMNYKGEPMPY